MPGPERALALARMVKRGWLTMELSQPPKGAPLTTYTITNAGLRQVFPAGRTVGSASCGVA
jgi:predicted transcriptional regulator